MQHLSYMDTIKLRATIQRKVTAQGFTLLELLVVLAIIGISASLAVPTFYPLLQSYRIAFTADALERNIHQARYVALRDNLTIGICPSSNGQHCDQEQDWSQGFISYIDINQDNQKQNTEELVNTHLITRSIRVTFNRQSGVRFNGLGRSSTNGTFTICDPNHKVQGKNLILIHSGRIRKSIASNTCV